MAKVLYREYRPKSLQEVIGQEHITQTMSKALEQGRISHAYLFTGPRGVGKTSIARILAHQINGLPYTDDSSHIDIIEIDAASNRRIDEIRDLREKVHIAPASAKFKVYIIDEVHMLTKEAFNALLKTLEEPPEHVVFILATTDAHKLPETIISRTQRFSFKPVGKDQVAKHLQSICKQEKIEADTDALELLAEHGEGSFRDSISLLDQARNQGQKLTRDSVEQLLGIPPEQALEQLQAAIWQGNLSKTAQILDSLYQQGYQASMIAKMLSRNFRLSLINKEAPANQAVLLGLLADLLEVSVAYDPERYLEIVILDATAKHSQGTDVTHTQSPKPETPSAVTIEEIVPETVEETAPLPEEATSAEEDEPSGVVTEVDAQLWPEVLKALKKEHNTLYGVVRMAEPKFLDDGTLQLNFAFAFHSKRLSDAHNQQIIRNIIKKLSGKSLKISCVVDKDAQPHGAKLKLEENTPQPEPITDAKPADADLSAISNIFGGGELLE